MMLKGHFYSLIIPKPGLIREIEHGLNGFSQIGIENKMSHYKKRKNLCFAFYRKGFLRLTRNTPPRIIMPAPVF